MAETRNPLCGCGDRRQGGDRPGYGGGTGGVGDSVYIDVSRILDSCRDRDCFENVRVYLSDIGQEIIDRASTVRPKCARVADTCISVSPMNFNRGFYQIQMRIFVHLEFETCVGGKMQCVDGLAVAEKSVILFGSEGHVRVFRSKAQTGNVCCDMSAGEHNSDDNLPTAVLEIADPVVLGAKIADRCRCGESVSRDSGCSCGCGGGCVCGGDIPEDVLALLGGTVCDTQEVEHLLLVSLGFFSVVRMERPAQFLVSATEYCVPDKECVFDEDDDPCSAFRRMAFPVEQFCPRDCDH